MKFFNNDRSIVKFKRIRRRTVRIKCYPQNILKAIFRDFIWRTKSSTLIDNRRFKAQISQESDYIISNNTLSTNSKVNTIRKKTRDFISLLFFCLFFWEMPRKFLQLHFLHNFNAKFVFHLGIFSHITQSCDLFATVLLFRAVFFCSFTLSCASQRLYVDTKNISLSSFFSELRRKEWRGQKKKVIWSMAWWVHIFP